ncbi:MAG: peptidase M3, partial [Myxococcales bacterium]|nr:peptidase M3 [Myxococcales bacterium]
MPLLPPDAARVLTGTPESLLAACRADMQRAKQAIALLYGMAAPRDTDAALQAYDEAMGALGDAAARASVCRNAHPDPKMRDAADQCEQEVDALATELSLDRRVYDALAALSVDGDHADGATKYYVHKTLRDLRRAGVDKDDASRARVRQLREELLKVGQEFGKN